MRKGLVCIALAFALAVPGVAHATEPEDTTPPWLYLPGDWAETAWDSEGTYVWYWADAWDDVDGWVPVNCVPQSGTLFPVGTTTVECTASDSSGNTASGSFTVDVVLYEQPADTTPPSLSLYPMTVEASDDAGAVVWYRAEAWDDRDWSVPVECAPPPGTLFPVGTTTVECTATDSSGNSAAGTVDITVLPPLVITVTVAGGSVDTVTGIATIRGTLECSQGGAPPIQPTTVYFGGTVTQRVGRTLIKGQLSRTLDCSTPQSTWSAETVDRSGLFVAGSAEVAATAWRFDPVAPTRSGSTEVTIRLRAQR